MERFSLAGFGTTCSLGCGKAMPRPTEVGAMDSRRRIISNRVRLLRGGGIFVKSRELAMAVSMSGDPTR